MLTSMAEQTVFESFLTSVKSWLECILTLQQSIEHKTTSARCLVSYISMRRAEL